MQSNDNQSFQPERPLEVYATLMEVSIMLYILQILCFYLVKQKYMYELALFWIP